MSLITLPFYFIHQHNHGSLSVSCGVPVVVTKKEEETVPQGVASPLGRRSPTTTAPRESEGEKFNQLQGDLSQGPLSHFNDSGGGEGGGRVQVIFLVLKFWPKVIFWVYKRCQEFFGS